MWQPRLQTGNHAIALEACAGLALACAYSSSDEYEADVIRVRRQSGAYGSHQRQAFVAFALAASATVFLLFIL
jgi:hypothetical protein